MHNSFFPDANHFLNAVKMRMREVQATAEYANTPNRVLEGYIYMCHYRTDIACTKKTGTYRGIPILRGVYHNDGLLQYENKEEAIHAMVLFQRVLEEIPATSKSLRVDKVWLEDSMPLLGFYHDSSSAAKGKSQPKAAYLLYLNITW